MFSFIIFFNKIQKHLRVHTFKCASIQYSLSLEVVIYDSRCIYGQKCNRKIRMTKRLTHIFDEPTVNNGINPIQDSIICDFFFTTTLTNNNESKGPASQKAFWTFLRLISDSLEILLDELVLYVPTHCSSMPVHFIYLFIFCSATMLVSAQIFWCLFKNLISKGEQPGQ